jgi:hypothetical protein
MMKASMHRRFDMAKTIWTAAATALACTGALLGLPASAHTSVGVQIGVPAPVYVAPAPVYVAPPPVYQYTPPPQPVWVPGHWEWQGNRHVWVQGQHMQYGRDHWGRRGDRDHDGIPDRYDRDRDGDGVPNWRDRAPDNRRWR